MENIRARVVCTPKAGQHDAAIELAKKMTAVCQADPGVVDYHWYLDRDSGSLVCHESFTSSQAFIDHIPRNPDQADFMTVVDVVGAEIYGDPTDELRAIFDQMGATYHQTIA